VRPFNKWLRWELQHYPLDEPWRRDLLPRIEAILSTGSIDEQRSVFLDAEVLARRRGLEAVVDSWGLDVGFLRA